MTLGLSLRLSIPAIELFSSLSGIVPVALMIAPIATILAISLSAWMNAPHRGDVTRPVFEYVVLGGDRVAEVGAAACANSRLGHSLISRH
jgi:hypothetical protein